MAEAAKTYADLVSLIEKSEKEYDLALIEKAYKFAEAAHQGQVRRSGEPYIIHPIAVAYKLVEFGMDTPSVVAGLLHDVIEDTPVTYDDIVKAFGKEIANLTDGVTKLGKIPFSSREEQQAENLRRQERNDALAAEVVNGARASDEGYAEMLGYLAQTPIDGQALTGSRGPIAENLSAGDLHPPANLRAITVDANGHEHVEMLMYLIDI